MTTAEEGNARNGDWLRRFSATVVFALAAALGLFVLAPFGWLAWSVGPLLILVGVFGRFRQISWKKWAVWIGAGLALGVLLYVAIGLMIPDGPGSGSGSFVP